MHNGSFDQGWLICLGYAYIFSIPEPEYAYKRAYTNYKVDDENQTKKLSLKSKINLIVGSLSLPLSILNLKPL